MSSKAAFCASFNAPFRCSRNHYNSLRVIHPWFFNSWSSKPSCPKHERCPQLTDSWLTLLWSPKITSCQVPIILLVEKNIYRSTHARVSHQPSTLISHWSIRETLPTWLWAKRWRRISDNRPPWDTPVDTCHTCEPYKTNPCSVFSKQHRARTQLHGLFRGEKSSPLEVLKTEASLRRYFGGFFITLLPYYLVWRRTAEVRFRRVGFR